MALAFWLNRTITIQRNTPTKDSSGAQVDSWGTLSSGVAAREYPKRRQDKTNDFSREDATGEFDWVIGADPGIQIGDRISFDSAYYDIQAISSFGHDQISADNPIVLKTIRRRPE